jgi:hypothetical protein
MYICIRDICRVTWVAVWFLQTYLYATKCISYSVQCNKHKYWAAILTSFPVNQSNLCLRGLVSWLISFKWADGFYNFLSLSWWNIRLKVLANLSSKPFKGHKEAILTLKMHTGSRQLFCKIILEASCGKLILPCSQWEVGTREHRPIKEKGILRRVSVSIFEISKYIIQRSKKKLYRVVCIGTRQAANCLYFLPGAGSILPVFADE